jgi:integrase
VLPARLSEAAALRVGEMAKLAWGDVDVIGSRLRIARSRTKSAAGQRFIPIPKLLMEELDRRVDRADRLPERRVFLGLSEDRMQRAMREACVEAGLPAFTPHDLRKRRISLWHGQGVTVTELRERAGHSDVMTTLRAYAFVIDPADDEWRDA